MSEKQPDPAASKEFRILRAMKQTLTGIIKDTATQPGLKHPLSERTIEDIRQCLVLISARERELAETAGKPMDMRPHYVDEPQTSVVVPIKGIGRPKKPENK
ncbi:MAG TPA: hypothetical protein VJB18_06090 [Burkholderiales bacterium]|nr:hypothetical protein [Burkholderiales bacterium]